MYSNIKGTDQSQTFANYHASTLAISLDRQKEQIIFINLAGYELMTFYFNN